MTDTVYVLRHAAKMSQAELHALINVGLLFNDAADEIEKLRSERSLTDITRELTLLNHILDRIAVALGAGSIKTP